MAFQIILLLASLMALAAAGAVIETVTSRNDKRSYPPPGRLVDVGGHRLHIHCAGAGSPVIVLDAGLGDSSAVWACVQAELAKTTRVCSYDRAGFGWSDPGTKPRTYQRAAEELHALLRAAGEPPPYLLVGHSAGANTIRLFAHTYPQEVAGMVLIEPPILGRVPPLFLAAFRSMRSMVGLLSRVGAVRLLGKLSRMDVLFGGAAPPGELARQAGFLYRPQAIRASLDEIDALPESIRLVNQAATSGAWNAYPVTILSAYQGKAPSPVQKRQVEALAGLSSQGKVVWVNSSHFIHFEHPEVVVEVVLEQIL